MIHPVVECFVNENVGGNALCIECRRTAGHQTNALGPWVLCAPENARNSILFVGKVARGDSLGTQIGSHLEDVRQFGLDYLTNSSWAYYKYTREIIHNVFGSLESGLPYISFTNLVKCNNESMNDTTAYSSKEFCIRKNRFIWKEISALRPRIVIFYTHTYYDDFIEEFIPEFAPIVADLRRDSIRIGARLMPWWERQFLDNDHNIVLDFLRVGHPMCKNRHDFVKTLSEWIIQRFQSVSRNSI
jgi:hypothetical protein